MTRNRHPSARRHRVIWIHGLPADSAVWPAPWRSGRPVLREAPAV